MRGQETYGRRQAVFQNFDAQAYSSWTCSGPRTEPGWDDLWTGHDLSLSRGLTTNGNYPPRIGHLRGSWRTPETGQRGEKGRFEAIKRVDVIPSPSR